MTRDELAALLEQHGNGEIIRTSDGKIFYRNKRYDGSSYATNNPNHEKILIDTSVSGEDFALRAVNHPELDDPTKNTSVGLGACELENLCVPTVNVPEETLNLTNKIDQQGTGWVKPTDDDYRSAEKIDQIADRFEPTPSQFAQTSIPLTDPNDIPCRADQPYDIPTRDDTWDTDYKDLMDKLKDLDDDTAPNFSILKLLNDDITERHTDGKGTLDYLQTATFQHLAKYQNQGLINSNDMANIVSQIITTNVQVAAEFTVNKHKAFYDNLRVWHEIQQIKIANLVAQISLFKAPYEMEALKQKALTEKYEAELKKQNIPLIAAQTALALEQKDQACIQKRILEEQFNQRELDRKLKQMQIDTMMAQKRSIEADIRLKAASLRKEREQRILLKAQTAAAYAQITLLKEQIKAAKGQYSDTINGVEIGGEIGARIKVHKAQAKAFVSDGIQKLFSQATNIWNTAKIADIGVSLPNIGSPLAIDRIGEQYIKHVIPDAPTDITDLPEGYIVAMSDSDFEGTAPTHTSTSGR